TTPSAGPIASVANAHRHPTAPTIGSRSQIEMFVSAKPTHVCIVSAVPTYAAGDNSVIAVENCAESAMMVMPHTSATTRVSNGGPPNVSPIVAAQSPLAAIATMVAAVRPQRSDTIPPSQHPSAPIAITTNVAVLGDIAA